MAQQERNPVKPRMMTKLWAHLVEVCLGVMLARLAYGVAIELFFGVSLEPTVFFIFGAGIGLMMLDFPKQFGTGKIAKPRHLLALGLAGPFWPILRWPVRSLLARK